MEAAALWRARPTEYLEQWSGRDRGLAEAHVLGRRLLCPCGCGQPRKLAHDEDTEGWWEVHEVQCQARKALEDARPEKSEDDEAGTMRFVTLDPHYTPREEPPV